ncbi:MAG: glycine--tRNA ligase [Candidatus Micrarchaeota archaeon]
MAKLHEKILDIAIQRGFLIPSAEIYNSPAGFYDYGPVGAAVKRKMQNLWRELFVLRQGYLEIETSIILPHNVFVASGHAANFKDFMIECKKEKKKFRADKLLEEKTGKSWEGKSAGEIEKGIKEHKIKCPDCEEELADVASFNLMFGTRIGSGKDDNANLRPETAQGIFLAFKRIFAQYGANLPVAIAQIGKSFRNEISPRQGLVRMREFTQMELEYFFNPKNDKMEEFEKLKEKKVRIKLPAKKNEEAKIEEITLQEGVEKKYFPNEIMAVMIYWQQEYYEKIGIDKNKFHFRIMPPEELPHYSKGNVDLEVETSYGVIETVGTAYRTDFDLSSHQKHSKQELAVHVQGEGKIIPHVIEPSFGVDRPFYCILEHCFREKSKEKEWEWFALPPSIAPYVAGIFPLQKKDGLPEIAEKIVKMLREEGIDVYYVRTGSIGKRYARADEIGVPYCITIDYESKEKNDVTIRYRDDGGQERIAISELAGKIRELEKEGKTSLK